MLFSCSACDPEFSLRSSCASRAAELGFRRIDPPVFFSFLRSFALTLFAFTYIPSYTQLLARAHQNKSAYTSSSRSHRARSAILTPVLRVQCSIRHTSKKDGSSLIARSANTSAASRRGDIPLLFALFGKIRPFASGKICARLISDPFAAGFCLRTAQHISCNTSCKHAAPNAEQRVVSHVVQSIAPDAVQNIAPNAVHKQGCLPFFLFSLFRQDRIACVDAIARADPIKAHSKTSSMHRRILFALGTTHMPQHTMQTRRARCRAKRSV